MILPRDHVLVTNQTETINLKETHHSDACHVQMTKQLAQLTQHNVYALLDKHLVPLKTDVFVLVLMKNNLH